MSGNSEMLDAFKMFQQGVSEYQTTQAVNDARVQLNGLHYDEKKQGEYLQQQAQIGNDLALRLTAAHASPQTIAGATEGLRPSASVIAQGQAGMNVEQMKTAAQVAVEHEKALTALKTHQMTIDAMLGKNRGKEIGDMTKGFEKLPEVVPVLKSIPVLQDASDKMHENFGQFGSTAITNLVKMGEIKASVSRVTEKEIAAANESPSIWADLQKQYGIQVGGEAPKNVQDFWMRIVDTQLANSKKALVGHITNYSKSNSKVDPKELQQTLLLRHNLAPAISAPADVQGARDWLNSEEGQKADPAIRQQAMDKINRLLGQ